MIDKQNFEKDIDVPSKRLDRIDKMETDLANYEQMERDIEKIIEPYQLNWELDCLSLPSAIQSILERKEQECEELKKKQRCAWKSLEGTFCPEAQEQLDAYKMEAEEGKEINAELKAENEEWKKANDCILTTLNVIAEGNKKLRQTLTEIKEIASKVLLNTHDLEQFKDADALFGALLEIHKKISEVEND